MRVTDQMKYGGVSRNLGRLQSEYYSKSQEASTGVRLVAPSTDPIAAAEAVKLRYDKARTQAHQATIKTVQGDTQQAESLLAEADNLMKRVHELAVQGANDSLNASDRALLAEEVSSIKSQLLDIANAKGARGYLFSGTATDTPAFDAAGVFQGNDLDQSVTLTPGVTKAVNASGARAFTNLGGRDVFADLDTLQAGLLADDRTVIAQSIADVASGRAQITSEQAHAGLTLRQLETSSSVLETLQLDLGRREEATTASDPIETFSRLSELQGSLEQAITVSRTVLSTSLVDRF